MFATITTNQLEFLTPSNHDRRLDVLMTPGPIFGRIRDAFDALVRRETGGDSFHRERTGRREDGEI